MYLLDTIISRRDALQRLSASAAFLTMHDLLAQSPLPSTAPSADAPLIRKLNLLTAARFEAMRNFYRDQLGFKLLEDSSDRLTIAAGATHINFTKAAEHQGNPFYHFAFNIPHNKLLAAREWQLKRTELVPTPDHLLDPKYPNDVRHFRSWNAHSIFFYDPAFNILEYIARHDLKNDAPDPEKFSTADILYASEIGFVVDDQSKAAHMLHQKLGLDAYPRGTSEYWWAMGDERGLLLCFNKGRLFAENTATPKKFDVFPTEATIRVSKKDAPRVLDFEGFPYRVVVE
jgi:catechol-2,3-dioxygenase